MRTITSASEIDALFRQGRRAGTDLLIVLDLPTPQRRGPEGRVVFVAGKKLGGAVLRNRCKRVMRAAVRRHAGPWAGHDVALVARRGIATADVSQIDAALTMALSRTAVRS
ncbi:MAG: ribonuclease P protein component [Coriobacteriia bacterium]|nr:ribonuclease P protein component [Coriobacteriia bacterium]